MTPIIRNIGARLQTPQAGLAHSSKQNSVPQAKAEAVRGKFDVSDIRLTPEAQKDAYSFVYTPPKVPASSEQAPSSANLIDNEEDNPHSSEVVVTAKAFKTKKVFSDGIWGIEFTDPWNDNGYDGYASGMDDNGSGDRFFFHASTDFIMDAAQKYAKIGDDQDFKYRPTKDQDFLKSAIDFFYGGSAPVKVLQSAQKQMDGVVRELADRIKTGGNTDLHTLHSKITIQGTDLTVGDLMDMQKSLGRFQNSIKHTLSSFGTNDSDQWARLGMLKPLTHAYAQNFSPNLRSGVEKAFDADADRAYRKAVNIQEKWHQETEAECGKSTRNDLYYSSNAYYGTIKVDIYQSFSNLDGSSKSAMESDFEGRLAQFASKIETMYAGFASDGFPDDTQWYVDRVRKFFNQVTDTI